MEYAGEGRFRAVVHRLLFTLQRMDEEGARHGAKKVVLALLLLLGSALGGEHRIKKQVPVHGLAEQYVPNMSADKPYDVHVIGDKDIDLLKAWPGRVEVDRYYWTTVGVVRDEYKLGYDFSPQFVLVLGAQKDGVCINIPGECPGFTALVMKKWDRDKFIVGVTQISIYAMAYYQHGVVALAERSRRHIDAEVSVGQLKKENK